MPSLEAKYATQCELRDKMERAEELWDDPQTYVPRRDYSRPLRINSDTQRVAALEAKVESLGLTLVKLHQIVRRLEMGLTPDGTKPIQR